MMRYLGGLKYFNLSCCAGTGYDGYYALAKTALRLMQHPKALVLYVTLTALPRSDLKADQTRVHEVFDTFGSWFAIPSEALRPSLTDFVYSMDGIITARQDSLAVLNTGWYALMAQTDGWMPAPESTMSGAERTRYFSTVWCAKDDEETVPYNLPASAAFVSEREPFLPKFAELAQSYGAKLVIIINPYPCPVWNKKLLVIMHATFSELKRRYSNVAVYPSTLFEPWPNYMFVGPAHMRVGYERPNSVRVGKFLADALGIPSESWHKSPADTAPPRIIDLNTPAVWSSNHR